MASEALNGIAKMIGDMVRCIDPDSVMLNKEYMEKLKSMSDERRFTAEELEEIFARRSFPDRGIENGDGFSIRPYVKVQTMKVKGKMRLVPFIGIKGTF